MKVSMYTMTYMYMCWLVWLKFILFLFSETEATLQVHASGRYGDHSSGSYLLDSSHCLYHQQW